MPNGYVRRHAPGHPRNHKGSNYVYEHVLVAERALGKPLPKGSQVHHVNGDRSDNRPQNLVICPDDAYHRLIHNRERALEECGHADWRKCRFCKQYDQPDNLYIWRTMVHHRECRRAARAAA